MAQESELLSLSLQIPLVPTSAGGLNADQLPSVLVLNLPFGPRDGYIRWAESDWQDAGYLVTRNQV